MSTQARLLLPESPRSRCRYGSLSPTGGSMTTSTSTTAAALPLSLSLSPSAPSLSPSSSIESLASAAYPLSPLLAPSSPNVAHKRASSIFEQQLEYEPIGSPKVQPVILPSRSERVRAGAKLAPLTAPAPPLTAPAPAPPQPSALFSYLHQDPPLHRDASSIFSPVLARPTPIFFAPRRATARRSGAARIRPVLPPWASASASALSPVSASSDHIFEPRPCGGVASIAAAFC